MIDYIKTLPHRLHRLNTRSGIRKKGRRHISTFINVSQYFITTGRYTTVIPLFHSIHWSWSHISPIGRWMSLTSSSSSFGFRTRSRSELHVSACLCAVTNPSNLIANFPSLVNLYYCCGAKLLLEALTMMSLAFYFLKTRKIEWGYDSNWIDHYWVEDLNTVTYFQVLTQALLYKTPRYSNVEVIWLLRLRNPRISFSEWAFSQKKSLVAALPPDRNNS
jgi:hypothetical protein